MNMACQSSVRFVSATLASLLLVNVFALPAKSSNKVCSLTISESNISVEGTAFADVICIQGDNVTLFASTGDDTVLNTGTGNVIDLGPGNDFLDSSLSSSVEVDGGLGNDTILGSGTEDSLSGGSGNDVLRGMSGEDGIYGGDGNDQIFGGLGDDELFGEVGIDVILGEQGDDLLVGGLGSDQVNGGPGLNVCDYTSKEKKVKTCAYDNRAPKAIGSLAPSQINLSSSSNYQLYLSITDSAGLRKIKGYCYSGDRLASLFDLDLADDSITGFADGPNGFGLPEIVNRVGDPKDFSFSILLAARAGTPAGIAVCSVETLDVIGNKSISQGVGAGTFSRNELDGVDDDIPYVSFVGWRESVVDSAEQINLATARVEISDQTGLEQLYLNCILRIGSDESFRKTWAEVTTSLADDKTRVSQSGNTLLLDLQLEIPIGQIPGRYTCNLDYTDLLGNRGQTPVGFLYVERSSGNFDDSGPDVAIKTSKDVVEVGSQEDNVVIFVTVTDSTRVGHFSIECNLRNDDGGVSTLFSLSWTGNYNSMYSSGLTINNFVNGETVTTVPDRLVETEEEVQIDFPIVVPFGASAGRPDCTSWSFENVGSYVNHSIQRHGASSIGLLNPASPMFRIDRTPPGLPSAPLNLSIESLFATKATLNWEAPQFAGDPVFSGYDIGYSLDGKLWKTFVRSSNLASTADVSNLKPQQTYWFRVRANNGGNDLPGSPGSAWSEVVKFTTPSANVPFSVIGFVASQTKARSADLAWSYAYDGGSRINGFRAEISSDGGLSWKAIRHRSSTSRVLSVKGLLPATAYQVRVFAKNSVGYSSPSVVSFVTQNDRPEAVQNIRSIASASGSVDLSWEKPATNGSEIQFYTVQISSDGKKWLQIGDATSDRTSLSLIGLRPNRAYFVRVAAQNSLGQGPFSKSVKVFTG